MNRTSPRSLAAIALVWSALTVVPASGAPLKVCGPGGTIEDVGGGWLMSHPKFPSGPAEVTLVASPAFDPNLVYATNGLALMRSRDAGCGWQTVYEAATNTVSGNGAITALTVPSSANNSSYVYLGVTTTLAGVSQPSILVSNNYGDDWSQSGEGLPDVGAVREIAVSPQVQIVAFAVVDLKVGDVVSKSGLYSSSDGGETWTERTPLAGDFTPHGLIVDPVHQGSLFALDDTKVVRSLDNAMTFEETEGDPGVPIDELSAAPGKGAIRLAGNRGDGTGIARSDDNGKTWRTLSTPVPPRSVAMAPLQDVVAVSSGAEAWLLANGIAQPITPGEGGAPMQVSITSPTPTGYAVTGVASGGVVRASFQVGTTRVLEPVNGRPLLLLPTTPFTQFPSVLLPQKLTVRLAAGETRRVPYRLLLPRTPTPVDVMFLLDSTGSYQPIIDGLREALADIVNALNTAGLDVRFGVGNFEDYPPPYGIGGSENVPYNLGRRIGPSDDEFAEALQEIVAHGGTSDGGQSSLTAIYQAITGEGEVIKGKRVIDKGLDARFRRDSLKLVMTSTDTAPHYRGQKFDTCCPERKIAHPGPSYAQVIQALRKHEVRSVGIPVPQQGAEEPLRRLARASNALAPLGGVDCNGDGRYDLDTGDPLVCPLDSGDPKSTSGGGYGLAAAVIGIVAGIADHEAVGLRVTKGAERARIVTNPVRVVDLHNDNELDYDIQLTCPKAAAKNYEVALHASTPIRSLAGGSLTLACGGVPGAKPELFDSPPVFPPRAAAAHGVSDISVTVQTNPNTNPQPNANPNPSLNLNVGAAVQQDKQFQLALAGEDSIRPSEDLAMSDWREMGPDPAFGVAAAAMLAGASGVALRRRRRTAFGLRGVHITRF